MNVKSFSELIIADNEVSYDPNFPTYVANLTGNLHRFNDKLTVTTIHSISFTDDDIIVSDENNHSVVLVCMDDIDHVGFADSVANKLTSEDSPVKIGTLIKAIRIFPEDFSKYEAMARYLAALFRVVNEPDHVRYNINSMNLIFNGDHDTYERLYDTYNPHKLALRHDSTLVLYDKSKDDHGKEADIPVVLIGAYTDFVPVANPVLRFIPVIHISEITALYPSLSALIFYIAAAIRWFVTMGNWYTPWIIDKAYSLKNLVTSEAREYCDTDDDVRKFIAEYLLNPIVALDVTPNRAGLVGIDKLSFDVANGNNYVDTLNDMLDKCGASCVLPGGCNSGYLSFGGAFFRGRCKPLDEFIDTANIDYLRARALKQFDKALSFETQMTPDEQYNLIRKIEKTCSSKMYETDVLLVSMELGRLMNDAMYHIFDTHRNAYVTWYNNNNNGCI